MFFLNICHFLPLIASLFISLPYNGVKHETPTRNPTYTVPELHMMSGEDHASDDSQARVVSSLSDTSPVDSDFGDCDTSIRPEPTLPAATCEQTAYVTPIPLECPRFWSGLRDLTLRGADLCGSLIAIKAVHKESRTRNNFQEIAVQAETMSRNGVTLRSVEGRIRIASSVNMGALTLETLGNSNAVLWRYCEHMTNKELPKAEAKADKWSQGADKSVRHKKRLSLQNELITVMKAIPARSQMVTWLESQTAASKAPQLPES